MRLQRLVLDRDELTRLVGLKPTTFDQRVHQRQIVFGFGCWAVPHSGEYLAYDGHTILQTYMLHTAAKIDLKSATEIVAEHWKPLLYVGLTEAELNPDADWPDQTYLAVGVTPDGKPHTVVKTGFKAAYAAIEKFAPIENVTLLSQQRVRRQLYANAREYKVNIPTKLTVAKGEPGYEEWLAQIDDHRRLAEAKYKAKLKARKARATA